MSTFLITGMGRSGTAFLARACDAVPGWRVRHEPAGSRDARAPAERVQHRFNSEAALGPYGEVNSYLRYVARDLSVDRLGVLVRRPDAVWVSIANRTPKEAWPARLADYERAVDEMIHLMRERGALPIRFASMVNSPHYLMHVRGHFTGCFRAVPPALLEPVNATGPRTYRLLDEFDPGIRDRVKALRSSLADALAGAGPCRS